MAARLHYTVAQAAAICGLSAHTLYKAFESGDLAGFRVPGSTHRRIPAPSLREWMDRHGVPTDRLDPPPAPPPSPPFPQPLLYIRPPSGFVSFTGMCDHARDSFSQADPCPSESPSS